MGLLRLAPAISLVKVLREKRRGTSTHHLPVFQHLHSSTSSTHFVPSTLWPYLLLWQCSQNGNFITVELCKRVNPILDRTEHEVPPPFPQTNQNKGPFDRYPFLSLERRFQRRDGTTVKILSPSNACLTFEGGRIWKRGLRGWSLLTDSYIWEKFVL